MEEPSSQQDEHQWLSLGRLSHWAWEKVFTKLGASIFFAGSTAFGMYWYADADKPWMIVLSPLAILVIGMFLFFAGVISVFGDSFADWAMGKLFKAPNPRNPLQQFLYFSLSAIGFVLAAIVLNIGDPDVRGYWHH